MGFADIIYQKDGAIAIIKINCPKVLNAVRDQVWREISVALADAKEDNSVRALIITGEGRAFSVGADIKELGQFFSGKINFLEVRENVLRMQRVTREIMSLPKPVIAAVNGYAMGAGAEIAIACDFRIASENAVFGFPEVKVGLLETNGVTHILPRLVGLGKAKELMMTGDEIDANEANRIGLVERVVPHQSLMEEAKKFGEKIAANAPLSVSLVKACLNKGAETDLETALLCETEALMACSFTEDVREGALAFLENRKPAFMGK